MGNFTKKLLLLACTILLLGSCATTDDPREGGLFSYDPEAYEKRLVERRERLTKLEEKQEAEKQKSTELDEQKVRTADSLEDLAEKSKDLDKEIDKLEELIKNSKVRSEEKKQELWKINVELQAVKKKLARLKSESSSDVAAKEKDIERLKMRIDELLKEAEELGNL